MRSRLGECLVRAGLVSEDRLRPAVEEQERTGERLGVVLVRMGIATEGQIADALAGQLGFRSVDLNETPPDPAAVRLIDRELAARAACIAIALDRHVLTVAMADPLAFSLVPDLEAQTGCRIQEVIATRSAILAAIDTSYQSSAVPAPRERAGSDADESDLELQSLLESILERALERDATDIHLDPLEERAVVRYRVDGRLIDALTLTHRAHEELIARVKLMANLDVAEKLLPQAGRLQLSGVHFRATTLRTIHGERLVLRVMARGRPRRGGGGLDGLGMPEAVADALRGWLQRDRGMILVAGPSGSGRTTTLHAALAALQTPESTGRDVAAIEDPVEWDLANVAQAQVDAGIGLTTATALRAALAQKADVVLVGELADAETATLAVRAANDALILTAVAADDAAAAVLQVGQLAGNEAVAAGLVGVLAQCLLRRLCDACRRPRQPSADDLQLLDVHEIVADEVRVFDPVGCDRCDYTGFRGRFALFEAMPITDRLRQLLASGASREALRESAQAAGLISLAAQGADVVRRGLTTATELRRVLGDAGAAPRRGIIRLVRNPDTPGIV